MGRVVLLQSDARYEKYLDVALRTWLMHNDRRKWDFYLTDLGLEKDQIRKYGKLCHIVPANRETRFGRFCHSEARINAMLEILRNGDTLFNLDSDTLTLENMDEWILKFESAPEEFSGISEFPHHLFLQFNQNKLAGLIKDYPYLGEATFSTPSYNFGLFMFKGKRSIPLILETERIMKNHTDACPWAEQSAFNAAFYGLQGSILPMHRVWNFMLNIHQLKVTDDWKAVAIDDPSDKIKMIHYAGRDVKISPKGPYQPHEEIWLHWAVHAPLFSDLV